MAKIDSQASRVTAFVDDDLNAAEGQYYRPAAPSTPRAKTQQEGSPERKGARRQANNAAGDSEREEDGFLRARRRVPVRRGLIPITRIGRVVAASMLVLAAGALVVLGLVIRNFFRDDPRFRIATSSSIQVVGNSQVTRSELLSVFGADLGRNIFYVPLEQRRASLEQLPWVEHATVMRLLPDQLQVAVVERTPVAFVRRGNGIGLVDAHGILLQLPPAVMSARHYSFPVVSGISAHDSVEVRAKRLQVYQQFVAALDSGESKISPKLSEVDIADPEDVTALLPSEGNDVLVHFGDSAFLERYKSFERHLPEWRQQYPRLASVDMRYEDQAVLDVSPQAPVAGGQKPAAGTPQHHAPATPALVQKHPVKTAAKPVHAAKVKDR